MVKPRASLTAALAQKTSPPPAADPAAVPAAKPPKADDGKITSSLRMSPHLWSELKVLAVQRRCRVNDLIVEGVENLLALNGRKTAA